MTGIKYQNNIEKFEGPFSQESSGCTILINETIQNIKDFSVAGLYAYLATRPPNWNISPKEIMRHSGNSKDKVYRLLNELCNIRLLKSIKIRQNGQYKSFGYKLYLKPFPENQEMDEIECNTDSQPFPENQDVVPFPEKQDTVNQEMVSIYNKTKILKNNIYNYFEDFWKFYPLKKSRPLCEKEWNKKDLNNNPDIKNIIGHLLTQINHDDSWRQGFIPDPLNWIKNEAWHDDIRQKPGMYPKFSIKNEAVERQNKMNNDYQEYKGRIVHDINLGLLPDYTNIMTITEWKNTLNADID